MISLLVNLCLDWLHRSAFQKITIYFTENLHLKLSWLFCSLSFILQFLLVCKVQYIDPTCNHMERFSELSEYAFVKHCVKSVSGVILVRISCIWTEYREIIRIAVFSPYAGKYGPEQLQMQTLFKQLNLNLIAFKDTWYSWPKTWIWFGFPFSYLVHLYNIWWMQN